MPSGKTHDAITFILAAPLCALVYAASGEVAVTAFATGAFLFGGLMFGPDLDTASVQYSRWLVLRPLWFPYRAAFKHRSRWSHGLIFGTLFRVIYFMGAASLVVFLGFLLMRSIAGGEVPSLNVLLSVWQSIGEAASLYLGVSAIWAVFFGMWAGAASHTFADMAGTYIKTGRVTEFL